MNIEWTSTEAEFCYYGLNDVIKFGKYKHKYLATVIRHNVGYVRWMLKNIDGFGLSEQASLMFRQTCIKNRVSMYELPLNKFEDYANEIIDESDFGITSDKETIVNKKFSLTLGVNNMKKVIMITLKKQKSVWKD